MADVQDHDFVSEHCVVDEIAIAHDRNDPDAGNISLMPGTRKSRQEIEGIGYSATNALCALRALGDEVGANFVKIGKSPRA